MFVDHALWSPAMLLPGDQAEGMRDETDSVSSPEGVPRPFPGRNVACNGSIDKRID